MPAIQADLFAEVAQPKWIQPKARGSCKRDPGAGPGTCWYWWESCPKAAQRGCYALWRNNQPEAK